ncbi:unnamed protein product [Pleuronectes platessa]|uniref:Uncharacterized protein n=1 Tax=Pleuronectes platessa TaxID=8262 RepID=A0A9N7TL04_PLEPL|nr:unnamed protein product [Pleuronectes platessa]
MLRIRDDEWTQLVSTREKSVGMGKRRDLDVPDEVKLVSSEKLTRLIAKEIAESVNSVLSMRVDSVRETIPQQKEGKPVIILIPEDNLRRQREFFVRNIQSVQEIIKDEVSQFTESSSDEISDSDYEQLESGSTLEIKNVADDAAEVNVDEIMSQNQDDLETAQSTPSLNKVLGRIKTCAANQFAQVSISHIVEGLNNKYFDSPDNPAFDKVLSRQSMQSVMSDSNALLPTVVEMAEGIPWRGTVAKKEN